jgi:cytosine permease
MLAPSPPISTRWARTQRDSLLSTFSAFPFANIVAMLVGGVMTAALAVPNANPFGADNMFGYMNRMQIGWLSAHLSPHFK